MKRVLTALVLAASVACTARHETAQGEVVLKRHIPKGHTLVFTDEGESRIETMERYITTIKAGSCIQDVYGRKTYDVYSLHQRIQVSYARREIAHRSPGGGFTTYAPCEIIGLSTGR